MHGQQNIIMPEDFNQATQLSQPNIARECQQVNNVKLNNSLQKIM